jgi:hypothetical protein
MSIETRLAELVQGGFSHEYIESVLWASYSRNYSIHTIGDMVAEAKP